MWCVMNKCQHQLVCYGLYPSSACFCYFLKKWPTEANFQTPASTGRKVEIASANAAHIPILGSSNSKANKDMIHRVQISTRSLVLPSKILGRASGTSFFVKL